MSNSNRSAARRTLGTTRGLALACLALVAFTACGQSGGGAEAGRTEIALGDAYELWRSADRPIFLDVRSEAEYRQAHIEGSVHIPHTEVAARIDELRALGDDEIIVYCERGGRARTAEDALGAAGGFRVRHMEGDMRGWRRADLPVVRGDG